MFGEEGFELGGEGVLVDVGDIDQIAEVKVCFCDGLVHLSGDLGVLELLFEDALEIEGARLFLELFCQ